MNVVCSLECVVFLGVVMTIIFEDLKTKTNKQTSKRTNKQTNQNKLEKNVQWFTCTARLCHKHMKSKNHIKDLFFFLWLTDDDEVENAEREGGEYKEEENCE